MLPVVAGSAAITPFVAKAGGIPLVAKILAALGITAGAGIAANEIKKAGPIVTGKHFSN